MDDFLAGPVDIGQILVVVARNLRTGADGPSAGDPAVGTSG